MVKLAANISTMFNEHSLADRINANSRMTPTLPW
jgi:hydroxypyruvate isomerase